MMFDKTKWNQSDWTVEQKTEWQQYAFSIGYDWRISMFTDKGVKHINNENIKFFFLNGDHRRIAHGGDSLEYFHSVDDFIEMNWKDFINHRNNTLNK